MAVSLELVSNQITRLCKGQKFSLITDAATFKNNGKAVAIALTSLSLEHPVLLVLHHPDEGGVYDHARLADDVRVALLRFEVDLATQVWDGGVGIYSHVPFRLFARWATTSRSTRLLRRT